MNRTRKMATRITLVALLLALAATAAIAEADGTVTGCTGLVLPAGAETHTLLDKERGVISFDVHDGRGGVSAIRVRYADPSCTANTKLRPLIEHVLRSDEASQAEMCAGVEEILASGSTDLRGVPIDRAAGARYIAEWCRAAL